MTPNTAAGRKPKQETPYKFIKKIGTTNYNVNLHLSKTSKETAADKILRLIKNEAQAVHG